MARLIREPIPGDTQPRRIRSLVEFDAWTGAFAAKLRITESDYAPGNPTWPGIIVVEFVSPRRPAHFARQVERGACVFSRGAAVIGHSVSIATAPRQWCLEWRDDRRLCSTRRRARFAWSASTPLRIRAREHSGILFRHSLRMRSPTRDQTVQPEYCAEAIHLKLLPKLRVESQ
jgi:hypothetical protein